jgi:hypothetical protein
MPDLQQGHELHERSTAEGAGLQARLARAEAVVADLEAKLSDAISLCVALERLHGSTEHVEVLRAVQDVVINILGSEEVAIYEPLPEGGWAPVQTFGVGGTRLAPIPAGHGAIGRVAAEGKAWVAGDGPPPGDPDLTACVPLVAEGRAVAVLAVWRLLPHKPALRPADRHLLALLGPHAGRALFLTDRRTGRARAA